MILEFESIKIGFLYGIFIISVLFQFVLFITMIIKRKELNFLSAIQRDGKISKAGIFFFILMLMITYQALFLDKITVELVELMIIIVGGDLGAKYLGNKQKVDLEKVKRLGDSEYKLTNDEIKNL